MAVERRERRAVVLMAVFIVTARVGSAVELERDVRRE
jgi:hypothetical protein